MNVLVLAAGYAVRMHPLTLNTPKPLLRIGNRSIIDRIIDRIEKAEGIDSIYVITNEKFSGLFKTWSEKAKARRAVTIRIINDGTTSDEDKLGAVGDIRLFAEKVSYNDALLVIAGDNIFECSIGVFLQFGAAHADGITIALYDVRDSTLAKRYGIVEIDEDSKRVVGFEEKPQTPKGTLASTCLYFFPKGKLELLKRYAASGQKMDAPGNFIQWLKDNDNVYGFAFNEGWFDIGDPVSYKKADKKYTDT